MQTLALQISPEAKSAYFKEYIQVAEKELETLLGQANISHQSIGPFDFLVIKETTVDPKDLMRLSFVQGLYAVHGDKLEPLAVDGNYSLHEDFVFGAKYKGKTNERLTQLLINVGLASIQKSPADKVKLLDPMCGRGTTLLWAMRYGIQSKGIEQDPKALDDIQRNLKKWTKLHRVKHTLKNGFIGKANKKNQGKFIDFSAADTSLRVIIGDSREASTILKKETFDLIVSDLPYGVQHFTTEKTRNPLEVIEASLEGWKSCLKAKGAVVLAFNSYIPKRNALMDVFTQAGFEAREFSASHRMSESIVRDIVVFQKKQ